MNLSISNIAWTAEQDKYVYDLMNKYEFKGLEIAPTRIFPEKPYSSAEVASAWKQSLFKERGFVISSMQSIWYGRSEKIFGAKEERQEIFEYTKRAIDFANVIDCKNLVFGCPSNRSVPEGVSTDVAIEFFYDLGEYALKQNTVIGMEANPPIYNTNYINDTSSAIELIKLVNSRGFLLNLDVGTMIENKEDIEVLQGNEAFINHVHISEPGLKLIEQRKIHLELNQFLKNAGYEGFISIEVGKQDTIIVLEETMKYVKEIFA
jgi:sugar phosphate isomerase/epimerase